MGTQGKRWIGLSIPRVEDPSLVQGRGHYVSDMNFPEQWVMVLIRSSHAHGKILKIKADKAKALPGIHTVISAIDWEDLRRLLPGMKPLAPPILAYEFVYYVGQPVVAILADNRYLAEDAADLVAITYESLTPVVSVEAAREDVVILHPEFGSNILDHADYISGKGEEALKEADHVISATLQMGRVSAQPMEPRGVFAHFDPATQLLTVYDATQAVHRAKRTDCRISRLQARSGASYRSGNRRRIRSEKRKLPRRNPLELLGQIFCASH